MNKNLIILTTLPLRSQKTECVTLGDVRVVALGVQPTQNAAVKWGHLGRRKQALFHVIVALRLDLRSTKLCVDQQPATSPQ